MKPRCAFALVAASIGLSGVRLWAQDATVGDVGWALSEPAPDVMPKIKDRVRPDFPDELKKTSEIGYVLLNRHLDPTGKALMVSMKGTQKPYERVVAETLKEWQMTGAKRGGQAIDAKVWVAVIFNPKSANTKSPDATPRLLAAAPVITRDRPPTSGGIVPMKISLDPTGAIVAAEADGGVQLKPRLREDITAALKGWKFAPARKEKQPVAAEVVVPVICQPPVKADAEKFIPANPISRTPPQYPRVMRRFGISGQVMIEFEVDESGKVINPVINQSDVPPFDEPAIKAVMQWKFQPATRDGKPVKTKMALPIVFQLDNGLLEKGVVQATKPGDQSKLPEELRFDIPAKFRGVVVPVYPLEARQAGATGKAAVAIVITPQGRVGQVKLLEADRPDFGSALIAAAENFRFDPAYKDGKAVQHVIRYDQEFSDTALGDDESDRLLSLEKKHPDRIVSAEKLDAQPAPMSRRSPVFPTQVASDVTTGEALVEFLIDTEGHARLPRVVSATEPAFGYAAVQAVNTWLFTAPLVNGKAVVTRARVPLTFSAKSSKPPPGSRPQVVAPEPK